MLHEFITTYREAIIARTREKLTNRPWPLASTSELENGVPIFLTQLADVLQAEETRTAVDSGEAIAASAARHGAELLGLGFNVSQVVHDYGDICQAITELAIEQQAPITTTEFHTLNRCLDTAIAEAVTEHARVTTQMRSTGEVERLGEIAHELRDILNTSLLAFHTLKRGTVAINGSTGAVLGRSLMDLRDIVDGTLSSIRMSAGRQRQERTVVMKFLNDLAVASGLQAEYRGLQFSIEPVDPALTIDVDPQVLRTAVMNLLTNAFKFTRPEGRVVLRATREAGRVSIEVEDECGGIPESRGDPFEAFGDRRGQDRSGLGLGLSIARKAVTAHGGEITIRNRPGQGCVFVVGLPAASDSPATASPDVSAPCSSPAV
jgi:signal transduction histidine kinase